jgi:hypothetical protein
MCPVDWLDVAGWGGTVHVAPSLPDEHDKSEAAAEAGRG